MSESVCVSAVVRIAGPRLRAYLSAPVTRASTWSAEDWAGITAAHEDADELPAAIAECDTWLTGDHASVLRDLIEDELRLRYDEATGSLTVDFASRADFRLPALVWAGAVLRGMAAFMTGGERGIVTVSPDWHDDSIVLDLTPGRTTFLRPGATAEARSWEMDVRARAEDTDPDEDPVEIIDRLTGA